MTITKGYGLTVTDIGNSSPSDLKPYEISYNMINRRIDQNMWSLGVYVQRAVGLAIEQTIAGKKAKGEYFKSPILDEYYENLDLTEEEKEERELAKMLLVEKQWQMNDIRRGLPRNKHN